MAKDKQSNGQAGNIGLPIGSKIGKYEVRQKLGAGGQAIVYKCYDELLDRYVAVKQISTKLAEDPKFVERFRKEAQTLARLGAEQPAIIAIYELVADQAGLFIVMELAEGHSLDTILNRANGPIDAQAGLQILWRLAAGLNAVHNAGIIHRDLKPANIIVTEGLKVKITDFGVAATTSGQTSLLMGTTKYMAPEVFEGQHIDARADIYSLGFIVYEMLAGRGKFNDIFADVVRDKHSEALRWMKWHGDSAVTAPPLSQINPDVPPALGDIVAKMLAKDPNDRFASMEHLGRTIKANFSLRERAAGPGQAGRAGIVSAGAASIGPGDEADQLGITPAEPVTAPLPRSAMSSRAKLVLAAMCGLAAVAVGIVIGQQIRSAKLQRAASADAIFAEAMDSYNRGDFAAATDQFADLAARYPKTTKGVQGSVMTHLARAYGAVAAADWTAAKAAEDAAGYQIRRVADQHKQLSDWASQRAVDLEDFKQYRIRTWTFTDAMDAARKAADAGQFDRATEVLSSHLMSFTPTPQQEARWAGFLRELEYRRFTAGLESQFAEALQLIGDGSFDQAQTTYDGIREKLDSPSAEVLTEKKKADLSSRLTSALADLASERAYDGAMKSADQARDADDKPAELAGLEKAAEAKPGQEALEKRIGNLRIAVWLDQGRKLLEMGEVTRAEAKFREVLKLDPGNAEAQAELVNTETAKRWKVLVQQAKSDFDAGKLTEALAKYVQAANIRPNGVVDKQIVECRFSIARARAEALLAEGKFGEALTAYESMRSIKPDQAPAIDAWQAQARLTQQYADEIAKGDEALKAQRWREALRHFRAAKDLMPTAQADLRVANARYTEGLTRGTEAMDREDYSSAKGYFAIAKKYRDTKELNDLMDEVEEKLQERQ